MVNSCCAYGCTERFSKGGPYTLHSFPKEENRRKLWIEQLRRENFKVSNHTRICSKHFEADCFEGNLSIKRLKSDAIPTIFDFPAHLVKQPKPRKRRRSTMEGCLTLSSDTSKKYRYVGDFSERDMASPTKAHQLLLIARASQKKSQKKMKNLKKKNIYLTRKVSSLEDMINKMKKKSLISNSAESVLKMDVFSKENIYIKNRDHLEEIVSQLIKGSASKLQIISDFDQTLSRVHKNGEPCANTYGIIKLSPLTSEEYKKKSADLFNHYHPIEIDPHLTKEEKKPYMIEWYTKSRNSMPTSGITKDCIPIMVQKSNILFRDDCEVLFESLYKHDVPLLIFSSGVGDVLKEVLQQSGLLYPNIKIISNFMQFDEQKKLIGFKGDLIHTYNKNLSSIENKDYVNHLKSRNNIILLGDSLGDLDMAAGAEDVNVILKIGFLNFKIEENLPKYLEAFDIVLCDDQTMDAVIGLLQHIL